MFSKIKTVGLIEFILSESLFLISLSERPCKILNYSKRLFSFISYLYSANLIEFTLGTEKTWNLFKKKKNQIKKLIRYS